VLRARAGAPGASREYKAASGGSRRPRLALRRRPPPPWATQAFPHISPYGNDGRLVSNRFPTSVVHTPPSPFVPRLRRSQASAIIGSRPLGHRSYIHVSSTSRLDLPSHTYIPKVRAIAPFRVPLFIIEAPDMNRDHLPLFPTVPLTLDGQSVDYFVAEWCVACLSACSPFG
jgi:hypothetical protein